MANRFPRRPRRRAIPAARRQRCARRSSNAALPSNPPMTWAARLERPRAVASRSSTVSRPPKNLSSSPMSTRTSCCTMPTTDRLHVTRANSKPRPSPSSSAKPSVSRSGSPPRLHSFVSRRSRGARAVARTRAADSVGDSSGDRGRRVPGTPTLIGVPVTATHVRVQRGVCPRARRVYDCGVSSCGVRLPTSGGRDGRSTW